MIMLALIILDLFRVLIGLAPIIPCGPVMIRLAPIIPDLFRVLIGHAPIIAGIPFLISLALIVLFYVLRMGW